MWGRALSAGRRAASALSSRGRDPAAAPTSQPGPAPITAETSNPAGAAGSQINRLSERERLIALAKHTKKHRHRAAARAATLACLRKDG